EHGQRVEIDTWQGQIIEGRHRAKACQQLGIEPKYHECRFSDEAGARAYVISQNLHRRHLTTEQKRELIGKRLEAQPGKSDRAIGKIAKVDNKTVASVRAEKERREEIPHVETKTDSKGRKQPAKKPKLTKTPKPRPAPEITLTAAEYKVEADPPVV